MSTKFGLLIDFDLLKPETSTNTKPEVVLSGRVRHISALDGPIWMKFGNLIQIKSMPIAVKIFWLFYNVSLCYVTHIKQLKYFHHLNGNGYNTQSLLYPWLLM